MKIEEEIVLMVQEEMSKWFEKEFLGRSLQQYVKMYVTSTGSTETHIYLPNNHFLLFRKNNPTKLKYDKLLLDNHQTTIESIIKIWEQQIYYYT